MKAHLTILAPLTSHTVHPSTLAHIQTAILLIGSTAPALAAPTPTGHDTHAG